MILTIPVVPKSQKRHEFHRYGKFVNTYDPSKPDKEVIKQFIALTQKNIQIIKPPIMFKLTAYMPIPKSLSQKKKDELLGQYHTNVPDLDNIFKLVSDALNHIFYKDDSQISKIVCEKIYDINPRIQVEIISLEKS